MNQHQIDQAYASGVLDKNRHFALVEDLAGLSDAAGIPMSYVCTSMTGLCTPPEVDYIRNIKQHMAGINGIAGLVYVGIDDTLDRMMAATGALLRNYMDARIILLDEILRGMKTGDAPNPTVALVPNFCIGAGDKAVAEWQTSDVLAWLQKRHAGGRQTVLGISSLTALQSRLGGHITSHIESNFQKVNV